MSQAIRRALYRAKGLPDPGPTPSVEQVQFTVLVSKFMGAAINDLADMLHVQFPSRNDLIVALLEDGLRSAAQAAAEAQAIKEAIAAEVKPDIEVDVDANADRPTLEIVPKEGVTPAEAAQISARLQKLRSGDAIASGASYGVRESRPEPVTEG